MRGTIFGGGWLGVPLPARRFVADWAKSFSEFFDPDVVKRGSSVAGRKPARRIRRGDPSDVMRLRVLFRGDGSGQDAPDLPAELLEAGVAAIRMPAGYRVLDDLRDGRVQRAPIW